MKMSSAQWAIEHLGDVCSIHEPALSAILSSDIKELTEIEAAQRPNARKAGAVAIIPISGVIMKRPSVFERAFDGAISIEAIENNISRAAADPSIKAIVLDIHSPGGSVYGVEEAAAAILRARADKHVVAVANSMAASAAYWLAASADRLVVTPSGDVGSVGVIATHFDISGALASQGIKATTVRAGKYKGEGSPYEPLGDDAMAHMQSRVDAYYAAFISAVAKGRGVPASKVRDEFGEGRMVSAKEAVAAGMADEIGTLQDVLSGLGASSVVISPKAEEKKLDYKLASQKLVLFSRS